MEAHLVLWLVALLLFHVHNNHTDRHDLGTQMRLHDSGDNDQERVGPGGVVLNLASAGEGPEEDWINPMGQ